MKTHIAIYGIVLAVMAALVTGCSSTAPPPELAGTQVWSVPGSKLLSVPHGGMKVHIFSNLGLTGPHYTLGIGWVARGQWIDAESASDLGIRPVRAPEGKELVVVAVTPGAAAPAFTPSTAPRAELLVGGKATPLPGVPPPGRGDPLDPGKLILISAAPKAPVKLRVTDTGRYQELDLRTGARSGDGYWQRQSAVDWKGESPVVAPDSSGIPGTGPGTLSVNDPGAASAPARGDYAILNNYQGGGWASRGQAFLTVPVASLSGDLWLSTDYSGVQFNDADAFSFTPAHGQPVHPVPATETKTLSALGEFTGVSVVVFRVPDNTAAGTVTFDLRTSLLVDDHGETFAWIRPPMPFTLDLAFTR